MSFNNHHDLERYSFLWSEVRLLIAALALILGGVPPIVWLLGAGAFVGITGLILRLAWVVSGVTAVYLLYRWWGNDMRLFGHKNTKDMVAFGIMIVSGINLGLVGLIGTNIGMTIASGRPVFIVVAVLYLFSAYYLYQRWNQNGQKLF